MPELGTSGSVRGVSRNGHPYRDPGPKAVIPHVANGSFVMGGGNPPLPLLLVGRKMLLLVARDTDGKGRVFHLSSSQTSSKREPL